MRHYVSRFTMNSNSRPGSARSVLRHPIIWAGAGVVATLGIAAGVLTLVVPSDPATVPAAESASTPKTVATSQAVRSSGVTARTNTIAAVRTAPGKDTPVLGTLGRDESVEVIGRSAAATWLLIVFPATSSLHGWVAAAMLDVTGETSTLAVATAEPPVVIAAPTSAAYRTQRTPVPSPASATRAPASATPEPASATPTPPALLPDLIVAKAQIGGTSLVATIINRGDGPANGAIVVSVRTADGRTLLATSSAPSPVLAPQASVDVDTGYVVRGTQRLIVVVNPSGAIQESNSANNSTTVAAVQG